MKYINKNFKIIILASIFLMFASFALPLTKENYVKGKVLEVQTESPGDLGVEYKQALQNITIKITSGKNKGKVLSIEHASSGSMMGRDMVLKKGDRVVLYADEEPSLAESSNGEPIFHVADYVRDVPIYLLAFLYMALLVILGGLKGLKSLFSLILTISIIFFVLFPLTFLGYSPLWISVLISAVVSFIVFIIIAGRNTKGLSATMGTIFGVTMAGIIAYVVGKMAYLTGLSSEESKILLYSMNLKIDYEGLLFGSILIGALGAVMDTSMSIASAIDEVRKVHPEANFKNLFNAGMNVGRDTMGTMSNTLILAYTGSALPLLLLLVMNNISLTKILNLEMIAEEVVRAFAGSIGLVICIPITAFISAAMYTRKPRILSDSVPQEWMKRGL
ncbi:hypothetical protein A2230_00670 [candidate division WOR-1 bacterium RIFOXYA2_FULL_36_21]|uniref:YibE/F family protein n=1 Tax=candidate division WOR-1 bacterium RIFOXYB2_FULL_36_35 TaxID=1802578 RepID=A0A1F4S109_UNCSA|nr:MAG: hypothetical protein A2230_00670 [candidate division WOR-1 bacterium RIFOXYA2_FULL_36_21]OGC14126.1 MAG: hypothetical protein A2290_06315 [candidate division WOR-1 bacterium RIFOXYB2_FULL_36_35]OGC16536.1 MAG: hypothetical protein A2282_02195 [candidate division WOR-1 bacterium RIFOXYA12_FULL_36_13]